MKLKQLTRHLPVQIKGPKDVEISGLCTHSRLVTPGSLFIAKDGQHSKGRYFIEEAVRSGAAAVVTDLYNPFLPICQLITTCPGELEAPIAANYYGHPSRQLHCIGVTGTNGKTTTSFILQHLLKRLLGPCGLVGTVHYDTGSHIYDAQLTTPESSQLQKLLKEMVQSKCQSAVMEISSHALDQNRAEGILLNGAIFTNLSWDHLDYHRDIPHYARAKQRLFKQLDKSSKLNRCAIVNADDNYAQMMLQETTSHAITYSISGKGLLNASDFRHTLRGTSFKISWRDEKISARLPLLGIHNVSNALAATACMLAKGFELQRITCHLPTLSQIPGRLQRVSNCRDLAIFIDFAHTEHALFNALLALRQGNTRAKLLLVFGCGGNRDVLKRPKMGAIASSNSDYTIITSDNSRDEDPKAICLAIAQGLAPNKEHHIQVDRRRAIQEAIAMMEKDDLLLIAGKGHEKTQIVGGISTPFDDVEEVRCACLLKKD